MKRLLKICVCATVLGATLATSGCAGQSVDPIDIHNPVISVESRRFVADAQDAVSIARSALNEDERQFAEARERKKELLSNSKWKEMPEAVVQSFQKLLDARIKLAQLRRDLAAAELALAEEKLTEVYAETAVRHDLETYDLEPIRKEVDARLAKMRQINKAIGEHLLLVDRSSKAWWKTYRGLLNDNKHPDVFFATVRSEVASPFQIERKEKTKEEEKKKEETSAKK